MKKGGYCPLSAECKEIRLIKLHGDVEAGVLRYDMYTVDLDQLPKYHALSYAWGAPVPESTLKGILIDEIQFKIQPTLFLFLLTMAAHHPEKSMWIDTICIDQANTQERNYQVSLMGETYNKAQDVYAWLGPGDDDTIYAIDHIKDPKPRTRFDELVFWTCVEKLFKVTYWTRRWVIQEFALAQNLIIVCGDDQINWQELTDRVDATVIKNDILALQTLEAFKEVRSLSRRDIPLLKLMKRFVTARCSVLQDRAYALRSIASNGHRLVPDYSESMGDLYFRLLSMLPTERVLPESCGYRWPHRDGALTGGLIQASKHGLLNSLRDHKDDRLYIALEYTSRVVKVVQRLQQRPGEGFGFSKFSHHIFLDDIFEENLLGNDKLRPGDLVYTLQTSPLSPQGLYVAFRPGLTIGRVVSMLI